MRAPEATCHSYQGWTGRREGLLEEGRASGGGRGSLGGMGRRAALVRSLGHLSFVFSQRSFRGAGDTAGLCWIESAVGQGGQSAAGPGALRSSGRGCRLWALGPGQRGAEDSFSPVISPPFVW